MALLSAPNDWIAVLGGATRCDERQLIAGYRIGREIARQGKHVITGATTGIPYAAAIGAKREGASAVGISPAASFEEHVERFGRPLDHSDLIVYTGLGVEGRCPLIVRSAIGCIFVAGEAGTLHEFTAAWMCGNNILGVLENFGGISGRIRDLLAELETNWGSLVLYDDEPERLVKHVCEEVDRRHAARTRDLRTNEIGDEVRRVVTEFLAREGKES